LLSYASGIFSVWFIKTCLLVFIVLSVSLCYFAFCKSLINEHDNNDECYVGKSIAASSATCIDLVDRYQVWSEGGSRRCVILSLCHHSHIFYCVPDPPPNFLWHVLSEICPTMTTGVRESGNTEATDNSIRFITVDSDYSRKRWQWQYEYQKPVNLCRSWRPQCVGSSLRRGQSLGRWRHRPEVARRSWAAVAGRRPVAARVASPSTPAVARPSRTGSVCDECPDRAVRPDCRRRSAGRRSGDWSLRTWVQCRLQQPHITRSRCAQCT